MGRSHMSLVSSSSNQRPKSVNLSASEYLQSLKSGPYTSLTLLKSGNILHWREHVQRLLYGVQSENNEYIRLHANKKEESRPSSFEKLDIAHIEAVCLPLLRGVYESFTNQSCGKNDLSIVLLLNSGERGLDVHLHATEFKWPSSSLNQPIATEVFPVGHRPRPSIKHSKWIQQRQPLEKALGNCMNEGILADEAGNLYEGFVTNLFVLTNDGVVHTAPNDNGVLPGIISKKVKETCKLLDIPLMMSCPNLRDVDNWKEAWLTNCRRLMQPIQSMNGNALQFKHKGTSDRFWKDFDSPGPITSKIYDHLYCLCSNDYYNLLADK